MNAANPSWGLVSTIKAPMEQVLDFCAWHLELGAKRLFIHLDEPDDALFNLLKSHSKIRPLVTDTAYWAKVNKRRPHKHQVRQSLNATRTYLQRADVDWLCHIDVDEFLIPDGAIGPVLAGLPDHCHVARIRPMESLAPVGQVDSSQYFKRFVANPQQRRAVSDQVWPTFGPYLNGGFLSHVAGKIMVRTGLTDSGSNDLQLRIHNLITADGDNPGQVELDQVLLAHMHAKSWDDWLAHYRFRLAQGSYRSELKPMRPKGQGGMTLHDLFAMIEADGGETALRGFFDEVCAATPEQLQRLKAAGLLHELATPLGPQLVALRQKHFGNQDQ